MPRSQAQSILSTASLFRTCAPRDLSWIRIHFLSGGVSRPTVWTEIRSHSAQIPLRSDPTPLRSHSAQISLRSDPTPLRSHVVRIAAESVDPSVCSTRLFLAGERCCGISRSEDLLHFALLRAGRYQHLPFGVDILRNARHAAMRNAGWCTRECECKGGSQ